VLALCGFFVATAAAAATLELTDEARERLTPSKSPPSAASIAAAFRAFNWQQVRAPGKSAISTRVSGLLLDAARNATGVGGTGSPYGVKVAGGNIDAVLLATSAAAAASLADQARSLGAVIRGTVGPSVFVSMPVARVAQLEQLSALEAAWPDWSYAPLGIVKPVDTEGVASAHVAPLHARGITGRGVRVGIIDMGFERYKELAAQGILPQPSAEFGDRAAWQSRGAHGTACAEIVHAMAPQAQIWLAAFNGDQLSALNAMRWLAAQHVDVISASWGMKFGSKRGNTLIDRTVDQLVRQNGILWVAASGNEGDTHWRGQSTVSPATGRIRVRNSPVAGEDVLALDIGRKGPWTVVATWDDWPGDGADPRDRQDIDLYLLGLDQVSGKLIPLTLSREQQKGMQEPMETITDPSGQLPAGTRVYLALDGKHVTRLLNVHVNVLTGDVSLTPSVASGSINSPASAREALAVGGYDIAQRRIAAYSSQGPTDDGRTKPEVAGPTHVASVAFQEESAGGIFDGTSASAPHVSGFAALIAQAQPGLRGASLRAAVERAVESLTSPVPNNVSGYGLIDGERVGSGPPSPQAPRSPPARPPDALDQMIDMLLREQADAPR
jgi:hypothetical protein